MHQKVANRPELECNDREDAEARVERLGGWPLLTLAVGIGIIFDRLFWGFKT